MNDVAELKAKLAEKKTELEGLVNEANARIAFLNGQVAMLQELVDSATTSNATEAADADVESA